MKRHSLLEFKWAVCSFIIFATRLKNRPANVVSLYACLFYPVWIIYEQVMIAALDCSRDDLAWVSFCYASVTFFSPFVLLTCPTSATAK